MWREQSPAEEITQDLSLSFFTLLWLSLASKDETLLDKLKSLKEFKDVIYAFFMYYSLDINCEQIYPSLCFCKIFTVNMIKKFMMTDIYLSNMSLVL